MSLENAGRIVVWAKQLTAVTIQGFLYTTACSPVMMILAGACAVKCIRKLFFFKFE